MKYNSLCKDWLEDLEGNLALLKTKLGEIPESYQLSFLSLDIHVEKVITS